MADITITDSLDLEDSELHELANEARELVYTTDSVVMRADYHFTLADDPTTAADLAVGTRYKAMAQIDTVTAADVATPSRAAFVGEARTVVETYVFKKTAVITVVDGAVAADATSTPLVVVATETMTAADVATPFITIVAADTLYAADTASNTRASVATVVDGILAADATGAPRVGMAAEAITAADLVVGLRRHIAVVAEPLTAADAIGNARELIIEIADAIVAASAASVRRDTTVSAADAVEAADEALTPNEVVPALFVNLHTGAAALWTGLPINSLVEVDGVLYGASRLGLHTLDSDDDDGDPIEAEVLWDLDDMGVRQRKRLKGVYVAAQSAGPFTVRVINADGTFDYLTKLPRTAHATNHRAVPGRGLDASHYRIGLLFTEPGAVDHVIVEAEATVRSL